MREGCKNAKVGDVCAVVAGQSPKGTAYNKEGHGLPFYQGKKEFQNKYLGAPTTWTTQVTKEAESGDVLMSVRAPVGPINFATERICIGRGLAAIRAGENVDREFLFYILLFKQPEIGGNEGAVFASINKKQIESIEIPLPPLPEQKRIVAILDEAFAGIETAIANTEKNLANARELFESYLNRRLQEVAASTPTQTLSCITELIIDCEHKTAPTQTTGFPSIRTPNISKGFLILDDVYRVSEDTYRKWTRRAIPEPGDLILAREAPAGNVGVIPKGEKVCLGQRTVLIRPNRKKFNSQYLAYLLLHPIIQSRLLASSTGATVQHVNMRDIRNLAINSLPPLDAQERDAQTLKEAQSEVSKLQSIYQQKLTALAELKQSLLQKAFSGELTARVAAEAGGETVAA